VGKHVRQPLLLPGAAMDGLLGHGREQQQVSVYVASVCFVSFKGFEGILQMFHVDVAKVDLDVVIQYCKKMASRQGTRS
jgi:hypothetical protein